MNVRNIDLATCLIDFVMTSAISLYTDRFWNTETHKTKKSRPNENEKGVYRKGRQELAH